MEGVSKTPNFERGKGVLQEPPCMHDEKPPKGQKNPCLKGEVRALPKSAQFSKKSWKKKVVPARILQIQYPRKAKEMRREMVYPNLSLDQENPNMQRIEGGKEMEELLVSNSENEKDNGGEANVVYMLS